MIYLKCTKHHKNSATALMLAGAFLLSGCAFSGSGTSAGTSTAAPVTTSKKGGFGGNVHGGQQPVTGTTVTLWAAGTTGSYGTGSTKIATTTTLSDGSFTFDDTSGVSPCTIGQYLYITASGGNSGAGTNNSIAMMAALPQACSSSTGATNVFVNEVSTIATVTALQQFMSINTSYTAPYTGSGTVPWTIGAPATNVTGMANAFTQTANLENIATGDSTVTTQANTLGGTTYTTTITPDFTKVYGLANVLSICINDTTGNNCTGSNGVLTLTTQVKAGSTVVPQDTLQAAYNMATLPNAQLYSGSTDSSGTAVTTYWTHSTNSAAYLATLWTNVPATAAFQPYAASAPADTAIEVTWKNSTAALSTYPELAIDGNGNIWFAQGNGASGSTGYVTMYNPAGKMQIAPVSSTTLSGGWAFSGYTGSTSATLGGAKPNALAIDTNNNAWYAGFYTAAVTNTSNTNAGSTGTYQSPIAQITSAGVSTGYLVGESVGSLAIDGSNNLYFNNLPNANSTSTSNRYYLSELVAVGTTPYSTFYGGMGRLSSTYFQGIAMDGSANQLVWGLQNSCNASIYRTNTALATPGGAYPTSATYYADSVVTVSSTSTPPTCVLNGAMDANNNLWGTNGYLEYIVAAGTGSVTTPTVTAFAAGVGASQGGLDVGAGVAIDGAGDIWVANTVGTATGGVSEFSAVVSSGVPVITALSPTGPSSASPIYGFGSAYGWGKPTQPRIDGSGNVWMENTGNSYLYYLVGVAAPVVTPISVAVKNGKLGARP